MRTPKETPGASKLSQDQDTKLSMSLYTSSAKSNQEIKKTISLIIASKTIKYLAMNLTKEVKEEVCAKNYRRLLKEMKGYLNKYKDSPYSWTEDTVTVTMPPTVSCRFHTRLSKSQQLFSTKWKQILKFTGISRDLQ